MAVTAAQVKALREKTGVGMMDCKKALTENDGDVEKAILWLRERGLSRAAKKADRVTAEGTVAIYVNDDNTGGVALEINCETDFVSKNQDFINFADQVSKLALEKDSTDIDSLKAEAMSDGKSVGDKLTELISTIGENLNLRRIKVLKTSNGTVTGYSHMGGKIGTLVLLEGSTGEAAATLGQDLAMHCAAAAPRYLNSSDVDTKEIDQEKELARKQLLEQGKPEDLIEKILVGQVNKFFKEICFLDQPFVKDSAVSVEKLIKNHSSDAVLRDYCRFQLGEGIEKKKEDFAAEVAAAVKD